MSRRSGEAWSVCVAAAAALSLAPTADAREPGQEPAPAASTTAETAPLDKAASESRLRIGVLVENDGGFIRPFNDTDKYYTSGVKLDFAWRPDWIQGPASAIPFGDGLTNVKGAFGVSAAQLIFTPTDLERSDPKDTDRPYAGILYGAVYMQRAGELSPGVAQFDHLELDLGVLGPSSLAEESQKEVHRITDSPMPEGWGHQLHDEPVGMLTWRRKWRLDLAPRGSDVEVQLIPGVSGRAGNIAVDAGAEATLRLGWNLPDDFGPARVSDVGSATGGWLDKAGGYFFARASGRAVAYDVTLDGNTWRDSRSVDPEPLVGDITLGGVLRLFGWLEIGYSQTFQTRDFEHQFNSPAWGTLSIRVDLPF